jgi:hypothetical protein
MKTVVIRGQQKWEHLMIQRKAEATLLEALNEAGQAGWEMVTIFYYKDPKGVMTWIAFLKRPSTGQAPCKTPVAAEAQSAAPAEATAEGAKPGFDLDGEVFEVKAEPH